MATIAALSAAIANAKDSGVVVWDGDLETILTDIKTLIKDRGILYYATANDLTGVSNSESQFAIVPDSGLWEYRYFSNSNLITVPYKVASPTDYYWVMVANYKELPLSLASLLDVNIVNPTNGQVLGYNDSNNRWENYDTIPTRITTPLEGQTLQYDTTYNKFVNKSVNIVEIGTSPYTMTNANDVLLLTDAGLAYVVDLPATPYEGKQVTIAFSADPTTGTADIKYQGSIIFQIDGTSTYTTSRYAVTFQYDSNSDVYVPISTS